LSSHERSFLVAAVEATIIASLLGACRCRPSARRRRRKHHDVDEGDRRAAIEWIEIVVIAHGIELVEEELSHPPIYRLHQTRVIKPAG
jgi:hypothetical protein